MRKFTKADLPQHKQAILNWIRSCKTPKQLNLIIDVADEFIFERFKDEITEPEMQLVKDELGNAIADRAIIIASLSNIYEASLPVEL